MCVNEYMYRALFLCDELCYFNHPTSTFFVQYMYMFQWPKLPEIMMSMSDYKFLGNCFTKPPEVCKAL